MDKLEAEIAALKERLEAVTAENESLKANVAAPPPLFRLTSKEERSHGVTADVVKVNADPLRTSRSTGKDSFKKKIVYLVRHAQAAHNVVEEQIKKEMKAAGTFDEKAWKAASQKAMNTDAFLNPGLSSTGTDQVKGSGQTFEQLIEHTHYPLPQTVLVSPLRRTLMTSNILFPDHSDVRATECIRERRTGFPFDERQSAEVTKTEFKGVDFSEIDELDGQSTDGYIFRKELKEVADDVGRRGTLLLPRILELEADVIAVVSHKGFIRELLQNAWKDIYYCEEDLKTEFSNAEIRVVQIECALEDGKPVDRPTVTGHSLKKQLSEPVVELEFTSCSTKFGFDPTDRTAKMKSAVATSDKEDTDEALEEAWQGLQDGLGGLPCVALIYGHVTLNAEVLAQRLRQKQPSLSIIGGSSMCGVIASTGSARLGIMGFDGWATRCGVGHVSGSKITDRLSARDAGSKAAKKATQGQMPDLIIMCSAAGYEEDILEGINTVCKGVRIFGGSSGNDVFVGGSTDEPWQLYGGLTGWGVTKGGLVLLAVWQHRKNLMYNVLSHCYGPTSHTGVITSARDRDIIEIDGRPATDVLLEWTGLSLPIKSGELAPWSLSFGDRLVHFEGMNPSGRVECFSSMPEFLGAGAKAELVHIKPSTITGALRELARASKEKVTFEVQAVLMVLCAGTSCIFTQEHIQQIEVYLKELAPSVLTVRSFGEQGNARGGEEAFHGNNMINLLFFG